MSEGWKDVLKNEVKNVLNVRKRPFEKWKDAPILVNTVSTVSILPPGYRLPLQSIANALGPCCQFEPTQFAAAIIKNITSTSDATALVFSSGKIVLTATTTHLHTMYMAHVFRLNIEHVECVMKDEIANFDGRTTFENLKPHNMVGHGDLGVKVDLRALRNANPDSVKWIPDGFPAAKCCVWLTDDNMCHCSPSVAAPLGPRGDSTQKEGEEEVYIKKEGEVLPPPPAAGGEGQGEDDLILHIVPKLFRKRCACTIKCLVFPTGRVVLTGGRSMKDINSVFYRMKALAPHFEVGTTINILVPRDISSTTTKRKKEKNTISHEDSLALLLHSIYDFKPKRIKKKAVSTTNLLLAFAEHGRLNNVQDTLAMIQTEEGDEIENVKETIAKLSSMERTLQQTSNLEYLKKYLEEKKQ